MSEKTSLDFNIAQVYEALSATRYACSSLARLTNGTTNFVFRGQLARPVVEGNEDGNTVTATTVIVKHRAAHAALNNNLPIDASRALYEESMLYALHHFPSGKTTGVKTPRLHLFLRDANTQVLEDFQGTTDLKNIVVSNSDFKAEVAASVGYRMGSWLRRFHDWSTSPNMHINRLGGVKIGHNEPMRQLKYDITYGSILKILGNNFPDLLEGFRPALEEVVDEATKKFETILSGDRAEDKNWGLIHGDFWSGNVLLPSHSLSVDSELFIVDWEFAQFGHRAYDIGQMVGDLYERTHFEEAQGAELAAEGFIKGYGEIDGELAFHVAIHAGVQLMGWYIRRAPGSPLAYPLEKVWDAMRIGRDWIVHGWRRDKRYFDNTSLAGLFEDNMVN